MLASPLRPNRRHRLFFIPVAIAACLLLLLIFAPAQNQRLQGSTFSTAPSGYGAWWQWMKTQNTPVQRWRKRPTELSTLSQPTTLLQIVPTSLGTEIGVGQQGYLGREMESWLAQGNRLVYVGRWAPSSIAPFTQTLSTKVGPVTIQGRRRARSVGNSLLSDNYGAIIWRQKTGKGEVIWVIPPFLAANAFQDNPANFRLLQSLLKPAGHQLWVDEYIHGYKDKPTLKQEALGNVWTYLRQTSLFPVFIQLIILTLMAAWWGNQSLRRRRSLPSIGQNTNQTYIQALAQVLEKANQPQFVSQQIIQAEAPRLARQLGLGQSPGQWTNFSSVSLEHETQELDNATAVLTAAASQLRQHQYKLQQLSQPQHQPKTEAELQRWLVQWQRLRQAGDQSGSYDV